MELVLKYERDEDGELEDIFEDIKDEEFPELNYCKINYVFRTTFRQDDEGMLVLGESRKLSNRERDLYGYDFEICIHKSSWEDAPKKEKKRLAWHELNHLIVKLDKETGQPLKDKAGRIKTALKRHDIVIRTFAEELEIFGPTDGESRSIKLLHKFTKPRKLKRRR